MQTDKNLKTVLKSIRRIARAVDMYSRQIDRAFGLTLPQLIVLRCVQELGEVTSRAVSAEADLSPPTVVGILDKLQGKGLIERYRSTRDRRVVHARLTATGVALLSRAPAPLGTGFAEAFQSLPPRTRQQTVAALSRIADLASVRHDHGDGHA